MQTNAPVLLLSASIASPKVCTYSAQLVPRSHNLKSALQRSLLVTSKFALLFACVPRQENVLEGKADFKAKCNFIKLP